MYKKEERYITVTDDWCPCYEGNKIKIIILLMYNPEFPSHNFVKIIASGADDYYLEAEYHSESRTTLELMYLTWAKQIFDEAHDGINQQWFLNRGLVRGI